MNELLLAAFVGAVLLAGTVGSVSPRLGWRAVAAVMVVAALLCLVFASAIGHAWRARGADGPGQGMYFLFMLLPAALLASTVFGLVVAWVRRGQGAGPTRAVLDSTVAVALLLTVIFAVQR